MSNKTVYTEGIIGSDVLSSKKNTNGKVFNNYVLNVLSPKKDREAKVIGMYFGDKELSKGDKVQVAVRRGDDGILYFTIFHSNINTDTLDDMFGI